MPWLDDMKAMSGAIAQQTSMQQPQRATKPNVVAPPEEPTGPEPLSPREIQDLMFQLKQGTISEGELMEAVRSRRNERRNLQELDAYEALHGPPPQIDRYGPRPPPQVIPPENQRHPFKRNIWDY